jgi:hypothetical protein
MAKGGIYRMGSTGKMMADQSEWLRTRSTEAPIYFQKLPVALQMVKAQPYAARRTPPTIT